jgi:hypothetical protein
MLTIYCPPGNTSVWETTITVKGALQRATYEPRLHDNGRFVIDVPRGFFTGTILPSNQGKLWEDENWEAMQWLGKIDPGMEFDNAFPGRDRPPTIAPVVADASPISVKMRAPPGTSSVSHEGAPIEIGKDGCVTVDERSADVFRAFGFTLA